MFTAEWRSHCFSGVDVNAVYEHALTSLMWAAGEGQTDAVKVLNAHGARLDLRDDRRRPVVRSTNV